MGSLHESWARDQQAPLGWLAYNVTGSALLLGALLAGGATHVLSAPTTVTLMGSMVILLALLVAWRVRQVRQLA